MSLESSGELPASSSKGPELREHLLAGIQSARSLDGGSPVRARSVPRSRSGFMGARTRSNLQVTLAWLEGEGEEKATQRESSETKERCEHVDVVAERSAVFQKQKESRTLFGVRKQLLLPACLFVSTVAGGALLLGLQRCAARASFLGSLGFTRLIVCIHAVTLACMAFVAFSDPGRLYVERWTERASGAALPRRAHKCWRYDEPILRFDHYCRWIDNCIGLKNHREFMIMTTGLALLAILGLCIDLCFGVACFRARVLDSTRVASLAVHLVYSASLAYFVVPIFRLHAGFISRNELAKEWKRDDYYVVRKSLTGDPVRVNDLSVDEYNEYFDLFEYDPLRNPFDRGCCSNCQTFWCTVRRAPGQLGEF
mmetsp:Transcript_55588/g.129411  ORF Transcript_55588/g.129411 Transcript_55588/m.129411 type:complete len:369 (-) Transcript_55588:61-1167(-)